MSTTPTAPLIEYDTGRYIDPMTVCEIKLMPTLSEYRAKVLVMRASTHSTIEFPTNEEACSYAKWLADEVNKAREKALAR